MSSSDDAPALIRLTNPRYADDIGKPVAGGDPSDISSNLFQQSDDTPNSASLSNLFVAWGQFLDHDLSLTLENEDEVLFDEGLNGPLHRSDFVLDANGARVPTNAITWQVDGSQIYGSSQETTDQLRSGTGGHLRMGEDQWSDMGLLPDDHADLMKSGGQCPFAAGDIRANENPALASMHTLMAREHNHWADRLADAHPQWDDDQLFEGARQIVEYELQKITYEDWLPKLIGDAVGADTGFDDTINGQISVEFSTAAFRFGHTMVSSTLPRMDDAGIEIEAGNMSIRDVFFTPDPLRDAGIDAIIRGQAASFAQEADTKVIDDLNFLLFANDGGPALSLVGLNILRGQDHGLQSYVDTRAALLGDIDPATLDPRDFSIITADADGQAELAQVYDTVFDVDLWVGGLAEDAIAGTQMGPLFTTIIADQFARTRAADETFGDLNPTLDKEILADVRESGLSDIILRNTEIDLIQDDPFFMTTRALAVANAMKGTKDADRFDLIAQDIVGAVETGGGDDTVTISGGTQVSDGLSLGSGHDMLSMSSGIILGEVRSGNGDDTMSLSGAASIDTLRTGNGDDHIAITESASVGIIRAGNDDDAVDITSRASVDLVRLGNGDDTVRLDHGADVDLIRGGVGHDRLEISGGRYRIDYLNNDPSTHQGTVVYLNADGSETGKTTDFRNIEAIACFTKGTRIITASGARLIETINPGDLVYTLDHGLQPVLWVGQTTVLAEGDLAPVHVAAGGLGNLNATEVSPQHRLMLSGWRCDLICGAEEVLAPAISLTNNDTITRRRGGTVTYIHLLFKDHEIIFGDGIPSESFQPGAATLNAMDAATRAEVLRLFPELAVHVDAFGPSARITAKKHEVQVMQQFAQEVCK